MTACVFDLETSIRLHLKRKATPFYHKNIIVAIGWHTVGSEEKNHGTYYGAKGAQDGWLGYLLSGVTILVGHNIKFDILHAICQGPLNRAAWIEYVDRGGTVWDTQLAEYLYHGQAQEYQICSLDQIAPGYGGNVKNDAIHAQWDAGIDTQYIDMDMLMEYLIGWEAWHNEPHPQGLPDNGDIGNTELVFQGQLAAFRKRGQKSLRSAMLNMGALMATIEIEYNGMKVDLPWALEKADKLREELTSLDSQLEEYTRDFPFKFSWTSPIHKSALIFGGTVTYEARVPVLDEHGQQVYASKVEDHYVLTDGSTMEKQSYCVLIGTGKEVSPLAYYAGGKNAGEAKTKKVKVPDVSKPKSRIEKLTCTLPGFTEADHKWETSRPGVYTTKAEVIEELGDRDIPFLKLLGKRAALYKDLSTYYITEDEDGNKKGMLTLVGEDGIIHHQIHMVRTITARLSSSDPNLQNVSKGEHDEETGKEKGSQIKRAFVSRFEGGRIVQSDFTSLEIYVQAILTACLQLIQDLKEGLDMHALRAEQAWGKSEGKDYDYILAAAKKEDHPEHEKWHKMRQRAKVFSFQRAYGAGVAKIAATTGMSEDEVLALIEGEMRRYPELAAYVDQVTQIIQENRTPTSRFCQHPDVPGLTCQLGKSYYFTPDGKMYSYIESPSPKFLATRPASKGGTAQSFNPTEIKNYVVQGTGGEFAKAAMYLALRAFYRKHNFNEQALLVNQVHDAIYIDVSEAYTKEASALLEACMLEATNFMEYWFNWPMPVGVPCETKYGKNMMEEHSFDADFKNAVQNFRAVVREDFINGHVPSYERS